MDRQQKLDALLEVAYAYYRRGAAIQYHQLSLDRVVRVTPRRCRGYAPEEATAQQTHFLDCSTFAWAVYHETFGMELASDLTWHMTEVVKPCKYYYTFTHQETAEQRAQIAHEIEQTLEPGDVMVYARTSGSGHAMLYIGDHRFMHCTAKNHEGDYDYENRRNRFHAAGGLHIDDLGLLFQTPDGTDATRRSLFLDNVKCFTVLRPMEQAGTPTENTVLRMTAVRGLDFAVLSDVSGGRTAGVNTELRYTLEIGNRTAEPYPVSVTFAPPRGTMLLSAGTCDAVVPANGKTALDFTVLVGAQAGPVLPPPEVRVNGFRVAANPVFVGKLPTGDALTALLIRLRADFAAGGDAYAAAAAAYAAQGITLPPTVAEAFRPLFYLADALNGDVLYRAPQQPAADGAAYAQFGGTGVVTPEITFVPACRTVYLREEDLMPGDVLLVSEDSLYRTTYAACYDGQSLLGVFEPDGQPTVLDGEDKARFLDSLFGRYAFVVLRPFGKN